MDRLGYDTFWAAEHRFSGKDTSVSPTCCCCLCTWPISPNASNLAVALTSHRCGIPCGWRKISPSPTASPAAASFLVGSWLPLPGVRGARRPQHGDRQRANRELFEDQVDIIFKAFNSRAFSHYSKHYTIPPVSHTGAMSWRTSRSCLNPAPCRSNAGNRSSVPVTGPWTSWPSTASKALLAGCRGRGRHRASGARLSRRPGPPWTRDGIGHRSHHWPQFPHC